MMMMMMMTGMTGCVRELEALAEATAERAAKLRRLGEVRHLLNGRLSTEENRAADIAAEIGDARGGAALDRASAAPGDVSLSLSLSPSSNNRSSSSSSSSLVVARDGFGGGGGGGGAGLLSGSGPIVQKLEEKLRNVQATIGQLRTKLAQIVALEVSLGRPDAADRDDGHEPLGEGDMDDNDNNGQYGDNSGSATGSGDEEDDEGEEGEEEGRDGIKEEGDEGEGGEAQDTYDGGGRATGAAVASEHDVGLESMAESVASASASASASRVGHSGVSGHDGDASRGPGTGAIP